MKLVEVARGLYVNPEQVTSVETKQYGTAHDVVLHTTGHSGNFLVFRGTIEEQAEKLKFILERLQNAVADGK